jgi:hypothetical protein
VAGETGGAIRLSLIFIFFLFFVSRQRKERRMLLLSVLSFACAKERTKEKHTGNDIQPLPDALIELLYYC